MHWLSLRNVGFEYSPGVAILKNIDFELPPHESFTLMGTTASGKTTLLKIMAGLLRPTTGEVLVHPDLKGKLAMTFQQAALWDSLTCEENLEFILRDVLRKPRSEHSSLIQHVLESVSLTGASHKRVSELSGGMQKRLALARAILSEPKLLICDDPTAGLDPVTSREILELLDVLRESRKLGIILVTTEVASGLAFSSKKGFLDDGRLLSFTEPTDLWNIEGMAKRFFSSYVTAASV